MCRTICRGRAPFRWSMVGGASTSPRTATAWCTAWCSGHCAGEPVERPASWRAAAARSVGPGSSGSRSSRHPAPENAVARRPEWSGFLGGVDVPGLVFGARRARSRRVGRKHVPLAAVDLLSPEQTLPLHRLEQPAEGRKALIALVEVGLVANDGLLDQRRIQGTGRTREEAGHDLARNLRDLTPRFLRLHGARGARAGAPLARRRLLLPRRLQIDELVARLHEQRGGGLLHSEAGHQPVVLAQLVGQRAEVAVPRGDGEGVDVLAG